MFITAAFIVYAALIPVVPLIGTILYSGKNDQRKRLCCWGIFAVQSLISFGSIISWLGQA